MLPAPLALFTLACFVLICPLSAFPGNDADLVFRSGAVYTVDERRSWAEAVAVDSGKIIYVGDDVGAAEHIGSDTRVIDLAGRMLLPGFHDSHMHPMTAGTRFFRCQLHGLDWPQEVYSAIRECAAGLDEDGWLHGVGLLDEAFEDKGPLSTVLDELEPNQPALITSNDGFQAWVNSRALALAGIDSGTPDPDRGVIERNAETGEPSGTLRGPGAIRLIYPLVQVTDPDILRAALKKSSEMANGFGITSVHAASVMPEHVRAYQLADQAGEMTLRVQASQYWDFNRGLEQIDEFSQRRDGLAGNRFKADAAKLFVDGDMSFKTAALLRPYAGSSDDSGDMNMEPDALNTIVKRLDAESFQVHMHVVGDRAVRCGLDAVEYAIVQNGPRDRRHQLAHVELVHPSDLSRFAGLGVVADLQPLWARMGPETEQKISRLDPERARRLNPAASFFAHGAIVVAGSDWISESMSPLHGIQVAVTRRPVDGSQPAWIPEERVSLADMISAYTINGAWLARQELTTGSIEVGKAADLIVLEQNLFEVEPMELSQVDVVLTLLEGRVVYRGPGFPGTHNVSSDISQASGGGQEHMRFRSP